MFCRKSQGHNLCFGDKTAENLLIFHVSFLLVFIIYAHIVGS
jgi:hypothetical protein